MGELKHIRLLVTKGSFEHYGGGERDLLNNLSTDSEALHARANEFSTAEWANRLKSAYKSVQ